MLKTTLADLLCLLPARRTNTKCSINNCLKD